MDTKIFYEYRQKIILTFPYHQLSRSEITTSGYKLEFIDAIISTANILKSIKNKQTSANNMC